MGKLLNNKFFKLVNTNQGFTLIEILVALVLITLALGITLSSPFSSRDDLDKEVNSIERAIRFMSDEAALRNAVIRMHFVLENEPQTYAVEYGPSDTFILPPKPVFETKTESKEDEEKRKKALSKVNMQFNKVTEFQDKNSELPNGIKILGIATPQSEKLQTEGEVSLYAYPSGEKDEALVLIGSDEDIISLKVDPYSMNIKREIHPLGKSTVKELAVVQQEVAKEIFEKWHREK